MKRKWNVFHFLFFHLFFQLLSVLFALLFEFLISYCQIESGFEKISSSRLVTFMLGVVLAPILETIFLIVIPYEILDRIKFFKWRFIKIIIVAIVFALTHLYSIYYFIYAFMGGCVDVYYYSTVKTKSSVVVAILLTILLHAIHNFIGFMLGK